MSKFAIEWAIFFVHPKSSVLSIKTETEISRFLMLKRTEWFLIFRNQTFSRTEEPNRSDA